MRPCDRGTRLVRRALYPVFLFLFVALPACDFCIPPDAPGGSGIVPIPRCEVGGEGSVSDSDGGTIPGLGVRFNIKPPSLPVGLGMSLAKNFPDAGSSYDAWVGARYERPSEGSLNVFAEAGPTLTRMGYNTDEYEIPTGEFFDLGGGAFRQGTGLGSQNSYGLRFGVGAVANRPDSKWRPFGQVGYDLYMGGAEIPNRFRLSGGVTYRLGGDN